MMMFDHAFVRGGNAMIIDLDSWEEGYSDGLLGRPSQCTAALDRVSYSTGYRVSGSGFMSLFVRGTLRPREPKSVAWKTDGAQGRNPKSETDHYLAIPW